MRVKVPADAKIMPHMHPEDRIYTIISGVFYIGIGDKFEPETEGIFSGQRLRVAGKHAVFPLGQVRRIHFPGERSRSAGIELYQSKR